MTTCNSVFLVFEVGLRCFMMHGLCELAVLPQLYLPHSPIHHDVFNLIFSNWRADLTLVTVIKIFHRI
jgi:hypothetical protein